MNPRVVTPPDLEEVVSLEDLRTDLRLAADGSEDESLEANRAAAHQVAQQYSRSYIGEQVVELALDAFPCGAINLPGGKVTAIESVTYVDENGATQTLATSVYELDDYSTPCRAVLKYGQQWPATRVIHNAVKVGYTAGEVTEAAKVAIKQMSAHRYEHRGDEQATHDIQPPSARRWLDTIRVAEYS